MAVCCYVGRGAFGDNLALRLTYVGLTSGLPQLRLDVHTNDTTQHIDITVREHWDIIAVLDRVPTLQPYRIGLTLDVLEARPEQVRLCIGSSLSLTYEGAWDTVGLHLADTLVLPDQHRHLINWMMRQTTVTLASVMAYTGQDETHTRALLTALIEQGLIQVSDDHGTPYYRMRLAPRRGRQLSPSIWQSLDASTGPSTRMHHRAQPRGTGAAAQRVQAMLLGVRGRFWIAMSPVLLAFLLAEWLLLSGTASFARVLSFAGVIANSLTAGIFPMLLLLASRRKGDFVPGVVYWFLDHPVLVGTIYLLFVANLFLHGLIIWQNPLPRVCAVLFGLACIGLTIVMVRRDAFSRRLVVELRQEQGQEGHTVFNLLAGGQPVTANVQISYPDREEHVQSASGRIPSFANLCHLTVHLPPTAARELKVWTHTITPEGTSESLPVVPTTGAACWVRISRSELAST